MARFFLTLFIMLSFSVMVTNTVMAQSGEQQIYAPYSIFNEEIQRPAQGQGQRVDDQTYAPYSVFKNESEAVARALIQAERSQDGFIKPQQIYLSLVHHDYMDQNQFGIMMKVKSNISGCYDVTPLQYEAEFIEPYYMDIEVSDYRRTTKPDNEPCDLRTQNISSMIVLNKQDLQRRQIKQIRFNNGFANDFYDLRIYPKRVELYPRSQIVFKAMELYGAQNKRMVLNFMDNNIVALKVPMAQKTDDFELQLRSLAYQTDMRPIFEMDGLDTSGKDNIFYFTDESGKNLSMLGDEAYMEFGEIEVKRPYQGSNGLTVTPVPLKVFAMRP